MKHLENFTAATSKYKESMMMADTSKNLLHPNFENTKMMVGQTSIKVKISNICVTIYVLSIFIITL